MRQKPHDHLAHNHLENAVPEDERERKLFKSQMIGFVLVPIAAMAMLGVLIVLMEIF